MAPVTPKIIAPALANRCRDLVYETAEKYNIPPVFITAHIRSKQADDARKEVWRTMIVQFGMKRSLVALIFDRHHRRVRRALLGV